MIKTAFALSLALSTLRVLPAVAAEKFECPSPFRPNTPAKLEEIKGLLPDVNAMADIGQLDHVTIGTLRREGMPKFHHRPSYRRLLSDDRSRGFR